MDRTYAEQTDLERRITEAGWHILRDEQAPDGVVVEFQRGSPDSYHLGAETRKSIGIDRADAYRHFLGMLAVKQPAAMR